MLYNNLISVIVPIYNAQLYLATCIESILNQTFCDFELLLIDDGSTDESLSICNKYACDKRVKIIPQRNQGVSIARNNGLQIANGKWIMFVDSDDYIEPDMLMAMHNIAIENPYVDLIMCGYEVIVWKNDKINHIKSIFQQEHFFEDQKSLAVCVLSQYIDLLSGPCCKLFRHNLIDKYHIRFPLDISYGEDTMFVYTYLHYINSAYNLADTYYHYNIRGHGSLVSKFYANRLLISIRLDNIIRAFIISNGIMPQEAILRKRLRDSYLYYFSLAYLRPNNINNSKRIELMKLMHSNLKVRDAFISPKVVTLPLRHKLVRIFIKYNLYFIENIFFSFINFLRCFPKVFNFFKRIFFS